jgi:heme exporter protein A
MQLNVENLFVERGQNLILEDISFELCQGQGLEITGSNGSGKTTLLRTIAGLLPKTKGNISLIKDGQPVDANNISQYCHYLGDQNAMKSGLSVYDNLKFWQDFYRSTLPSTLLSIDEALKTLGLLGASHLPYEHLSKGQRRRIALAKLLVAHRPIWLLDEPTSGLDKNSDKVFTQMLDKHLEQNGMALVASHTAIEIDLNRLQLGEK